MQVITRKEYESNESHNLHSKNAVAVVSAFGTKAEIALVKEILKNHKIGAISFEDQKIRDQIANKYWNLIVRHWARVEG
tara:strand:+ start:24 stop:260 length:237 start_codon:yes stop_codon:yes gene_type:complete